LEFPVLTYRTFILSYLMAHTVTIPPLLFYILSLFSGAYHTMYHYYSIHSLSPLAHTVTIPPLLFYILSLFSGSYRYHNTITILYTLPLLWLIPLPYHHYSSLYSPSSLAHTVTIPPLLFYILSLFSGSYRYHTTITILYALPLL